MASTTTFWNFIKNNVVEIPIIQRDYAQGRIGKENLRKFFLNSIKKALEGNLTNGETVLKLDFVYGSNENDKLQPLDGQQRLTTLWLLHWYVALRANKLEEASTILRNFTYETRMSSREFCHSLCEAKNFKDYNSEDVVDFITSRTWFYAAWKQDPTIQAMLRMLGGTKINNNNDEDIIDGIDELFACPQDCEIIKGRQCVINRTFNEYWDKLTGDNCPIVFYHLPLNDFGLSDDLYIKMNARGKQLTSFENFKADLVGYIALQAKSELVNKEEQEMWGGLLDPKDGIPIKIDTDWTDVFWNNKSKGIHDKNGKLYKSNQIDEIYFAFLNRFFWNELFIAKKSENPHLYLLDIGKGDEGSTQENENSSYRYLNDSDNRSPNDYDTKIAYQGLDIYKYENGIPIGFFMKLQKVLSNYYKFSKGCTIPTCSWDDSFSFIPRYIQDENSDNVEIVNNANEKILKVSTLNQVQRIVFFAICKYFDHDETVNDDEDSMKRWMRVVWNLVSGQGVDGRSQIRSTMAIRTAIEHIERLDSHDVYNSLSNMPLDERSSDFSNRWNEEINKAKQILNEENVREDGRIWEEAIIEAEQYAFFKGSIRFLFQDENGQTDWTLFDPKWEHAKQYFLKETLSKDSVMQISYRNADLLKMMMSWYSADTFKRVLWLKHRTFNNKPETWLYYLLNSDNCKAIHHLLLGEKNDSDSFTLFRDSEKFEERTVYILANTSLLDFVINKIPNSWIRDYHNHKAIYPSGTGVFLNAEKRDNLLSNTKGIEIKSGHKITDTTLLFGSDINFTFNDKSFLWYRNDFVYLMDKEACVIKNEKAQKDTEKHFCFDTTQLKYDNSDVSEKFIKELDCLIAQAFPDGDKEVCNECEEKTCEQSSD